MTTSVPPYPLGGGITRPQLFFDSAGNIILEGDAADFAATYGLKALYCGLPPDTPWPPVPGFLSTPVDTNPAANNVAEGAAVNTPVNLTVSATGIGLPVTYSLTADSSGGGFKINPTTGVVTVADPAKIDFETASGHAYSVTAKATDGIFTRSQTFTIGVTDVAPSTPVDSNAASNTVVEGAAVNTLVGITASSTDVNGPGVTWSLSADSSAGGFKINATTGVISVADPTKIDFESAPSHAYTVTARASDGTLASSQTFTINVTDVTIGAPVDGNADANSIAEGAAVNTLVGLTASAVDPNGPPTSYSLIGDTSGGGFKIDATTGVVSVANAAKIDFETSGAGHSYDVTVQAVSGATTTSQTFTIAATDVAPSTPIDSNAAANSVLEGAANGTLVGITASSFEINGPAVTYSLTDNAGGRFAIDPNSGVVTVANAAAIDFETATGHAYGITVQAHAGALNSTHDFSIDVVNVNEAPSGADKAVTTAEDTNYVFSVADFGFTDPGDNPTPNSLTAVKITTLPGGAGTLTNNGAAVNAGDFISVADIAAGHLVFTPPANANGSPQGSFTFQVQDDGGTANGGVDTDQSPNIITINVGAVNDPPVNTVPGSQTVNEDTTLVFSGANAISISDVDAGAGNETVTLSVFNGALTLNGTAGLAFTAGDGTADATMTFSGTVAAINTALNGLSYLGNLNFNGSDTLNITTNDNGNTGSGGAQSAANGVTINVSPVNDAPVVVAGHTLNYTENQAATAIDAAIAVSDVDNTNLASATVQITGNYVNGQDVLAFATIGAISGTFDALTGTMTLTGSDTVANYQAALRTVTYVNTSDNPSGLARTVTIITNDGAANSVATTDTINVTPVNDAPVVTAGHTLNYTENQAATAIDAAIAVSDVDNTNLASATVQITGNYVNGQDVLAFATIGAISGTFDALTGTMTLTGSDTVANYQAALRTVTYVNSSDNPSGAARTVTIITNDGAANSVATTDTINVTPVNDAPTLTATGNNPNYSAGVDLFSSVSASTIESGQLLDQLKLTVTSISGTAADSLTIDGVTVALTNGNIVSTTTPGVTASVAVTGTTATVTIASTPGLSGAAMATLVDGISYTDSNVSPGDPARVVTLTSLHDTGGTSPGADTTALSITSTVSFDVAPTVTAGHTLNYTENQAATAFDPALTVTDTDSADLVSAKVQITGNYVNGQDALAFATIGAISGTFDAATGTLTLTGSDTVANYQAALRTVTYVNSSDNPSGAARTVTITANDGILNSTAVTDTINVTPVNDAPVVVAGHTLNYTENQIATAIDTAITVSDIDSANLTSAAVQITGNYVSGQDVLAFATIGAISGTFDALTGAMTLTGGDTVANYQAALRTVTYVNTSENPSGLARTVTITANDGAANSVATTGTINVTPVNDAPVVTAGHTLNYTENQAATAIDTAITVSDVDNANLALATVQITGNYASGQDVLGFTSQNGITGSFDAATGTLTLTGSSSVANYQTALDSVTYFNNSNNPSGLNRTVSYTVSDGPANSTASTSTIQVTPVNDAPVVTFNTINGFTEPPNGTPAANSTPVTIAPNLTVTDVDSTNLTTATFVLTNLKPSDALSVSGYAASSGDIGGIHFAITSTASTETVTFTGTDTIAHYNAALDLVQFNNTSENPDITARSYTVTAIDDGSGANTGSASTTETVTAVNDAPVNTVPAEQGTIFTDTDTPITGLSIADVDGGSGVATQLHVTGGILNVATVVGGAAVTGTGTATVTLTGTPAQITTTLQATNGVVYHGNASFTGTDTLTVTTNDNGQTGTGAHPDVVSTEKLGVIPKVWFIDNTAGSGGDGSQAHPFDSIAAFNAASTGHSTNEYVYLKTGTGTYSEADGIHLQNGQTLVGQGDGLTFTDPLHPLVTLTIETAGTAPKIVVPSGKIGIDLAADNNVHGLNIDTSTNAGAVAIDDGPAANNVGNLTISHLTISGSGKAIDIDHGGGTLNVTIDSLTSSGSSSQGVNLGGAMSGSFNIDAGSISGSTGVAFNVSGGSLSIDDKGTIAKTSDGQTIVINNHNTAASTVKFEGSVSSTGASDGISLTGNTNATMSFSGGVTVNTSSSGTAGFTATGGGTLTVTGPSNSINSGAGTAVNVDHTTIGSSGMTFHDISANGGSNGIILNTTGGGLFHVTGGSSTAQGGDSSGGTIQNLTGADGTTQLNGASNGVGIGIYLNNASNVTIERMNIHDASNFGVDVENSSNFVMKYTTVGGSNGTSAGQEESSVRLLELGGTNSLDNNNISGGFTDNVRLDNHSAALTDLSLTNNKIHDNNATTGNQGILVDFVTGATETLHFTGNTFFNNRAESVFIGASGGAVSNGAVINATVTNNAFTGNRSTDLGGGFEIQTANFNGHLLYDISGNTLQPAISASNFAVNQGSAIQVSAAGSSSSVVEGRINSNHIGTAGVPNSGTQQGSGITVDNTGSGTHTTLITNNDIRGYGNTGLAMTVGGSGLTTGTFNATIAGNTITQPSNSAGGTASGINGNFGTNSGNAETINLDISGNSIAGSGNNVNPGEEDFRLRQRMNTDVFLKGYGGGSGVTDTASVVAYIQSQNTGSETGTATASLASPPPHGFHSIASVTQPSLPPLFATAGGVKASSPTPGETHLTQAELNSVVAAAIAQWAHAGASAAQLAALSAITFSVADLSGDVIGEHSPGHIRIDTDAAGHGWFIDPTPNDNSEFTHAATAAGTDLFTDPTNAAAGHLDLLTTVTHEMGHELGLADLTAPADDLMYINLVDGERRVPGAADVALASGASLPPSAQNLAGAPIVVGTAGNDTIDAGYGGKILFGGAGADSFVFGPNIHLGTPVAPAAQPITHLADYSAAQGDSFDFSALTSAFHAWNVTDASLVRVVEDHSGTFATLQLNTTPGQVSIMPTLQVAPTWVNVAQLDGAHAGDAVNVLVDSHAAIHLAHLHVDLLV